MNLVSGIIPLQELMDARWMKQPERLLEGQTPVQDSMENAEQGTQAH